MTGMYIPFTFQQSAGHGDAFPEKGRRVGGLSSESVMHERVSCKQSEVNPPAYKNADKHGQTAEMACVL